MLYGVHAKFTMSAEGTFCTWGHGTERSSSSLAHGRIVGGTEVAIRPRALPQRRFRNTGSSCYANTSLQLFGTDSAFVQTLERHTCESQCLFCHLKHDLQQHASTPAPFVPRLHLRSVDLEMPGAPEWSNGEQQDVSEFAQAIIRGIDRCANADSLRADFTIGLEIECRIVWVVRTAGTCAIGGRKLPTRFFCVSRNGLLDVF